MKRLLPAVILALAVHIIILSADFSWLLLAPRSAPAAKSLSITLSADQHLQHKTRAAVSKQVVEKKPPQAEEIAKPLKPITAMPSQTRISKARPKKNLKVLTRKKQIVNVREALHPASVEIGQVPPQVHLEHFDPSSSESTPSPLPFPATTGDIKKTLQVPDGAVESTTTASVAPASRIDDTRPAAVLKIARPLYKQNTSPPYPPKARRMGYEGIVMLKVLINENGRVNNLTVLKSSGYDILDRAALSAVKEWLFEPGTEGGIKKKMWVKIPIRFQLK